MASSKLIRRFWIVLMGWFYAHAIDNRLQFLEIRPSDEQFCQMILISFISAWDHYLSAAPSS